MSHEGYKNIGTPQERVIEEIGEVLQAIGKLNRFGPFNYHPDQVGKPIKDTNLEQLRREIGDLQEALEKYDSELRSIMTEHYREMKA